MREQKPVTKIVTLKKFDTRTVVLWHSNDMHVHMQGWLWTEGKKRVQFTPAQPFGFVAITSTGCDVGCIPAEKGYVIYRPCALVLEYDWQVKTVFRAVDTLAMQAWYKAFKPWAHLRLATR